MERANVLVTGGAGYVGSHACKVLAAAGYIPIVYDNLVNGHRDAVKWGPFEHGDVLDRTRLDAVISKYAPSAVMHFAAFAYVGESVADPAKYYRNNVAGSLNLMEAMRDHRITRAIFSSSCAVYGVPDRLPIAEDAPKMPINPYGMSKLVVERMFEDFASAYGGAWIALRYFNAAGCDPDGELGECHDPETHIIPLLLDAASGRAPAVTIYGSNYETPDGTCIRDYVHVTDLADAHVKALQLLETNPLRTALNIGLGRGYSIRELIDVVEKVTGRHVPANEGPRRPGDPAILIGDPSRAESILSWKPSFTELSDIVRTAWKWRENPVSKIVADLSV